MKCQHCGKNEATFYYRSTVNGHTTQYRLCQTCAEELGYGQMLRRPRVLEDPFFARPFSLWDGLGGRMLTEFPAPVAEEEPKQPESLLNEKDAKDFARQVKRNALQLRLQQAIDSENYEEAARVRDELRAMSA